MKLAIPFVFAAGTSSAACGGYEQTFLQCQIKNSSKTLSVCFDDAFATYRFGPPAGSPELELTTSIAALDYTPWPGVGSAIWEEVGFDNLGYRYSVVVGLVRDFPNNNDTEIGERQFGGVTVLRGGKEIANLSCDPESIYYDWVGGLSEAKNNLGFVWNLAAQSWLELPD